MLRPKIAAVAALAAALSLPALATADHCSDAPGLGEDWCHRPSPRPTAPPTPRPTLASTAPPRTAAPATARPRRRPAGAARTPEPLPAETPIPTPIEPTVTPEIVVTTSVPEETPERFGAERTSRSSASPAFWAIFVAGLLVGEVLGLLTSGVLRRRRKKQQIFG